MENTVPLELAPALAQSQRDPRLTKSERASIALLWGGLLSPQEYRPMKCEVLALLQRIPSGSACRNLRRLIALGYVLVYQPDPKSPRLLLLVNVIRGVALAA